MPSEDAETWEEDPARLRDFVLDEEYLGLRGDVYPKIIDVLEEIFEGDYNEAALCWGIGAGKSYTASLAITYQIHRTLCLRSPQRTLGIAEGSTICFMNMSTNGEQARRVVFGEILQRIERSPWFARHKPKTMSRELRFPKDIAVICGNSAETYPLGYNVLGAVIDEASWLLESDGGRRDSAEEIYNALQRRIRSRFLDQGLLIMISSPRHRGDFLERKLQEAESNPKIYASRRATWEVKPAGTYCGETFECEGLEVPVEYRDEFERNATRALRDLAARPAEAFEPFFRDTDVLERAVDAELPIAFDAHGHLTDEIRPQPGREYYVHVDLGLKRDACGIAMAHCEAEDGGDRPTVIVDLMLRIVPPSDGELELAQIRGLIEQISARGFAIGLVTFDGFQSADSRQILRRKGLNVEIASVDRTASAYETMKELLYDGRLRWYRYEPLLRECKGLEMIRGDKVDHRHGGSKDVADAVAGAVNSAVERWRGGVMRAHVV